MQHVDQSPAAVTHRADANVRVDPPAPPRRRKRAPGIALLALAVVALLALLPVWIHFATFNPAEGRLSPTQHPWYFPVLMFHIATSTVALVACLFQVWPWLRQRHPRAHRAIGRTYVFIGVWPAGVSALVLTLIWPFSAMTSFGMILLSVLWLSITTYGYVLRRQGRIADHRRWMLRSFALTTSTLLNEAIRPFIEMRLHGQLETRLAGSQDVLTQASNALGDLLSIMIALILIEWWLERDVLRRSRRRPPADAPSVPATTAVSGRQSDVDHVPHVPLHS
jgi:uncharacterized membrane protein